MVTAVALAGAGCGTGEPTKKETPGTQEAKGGHKHDSWWCDEHGVPEHLCIMCSDELTAKAKKEGEWCPHDKAKSQCFICSPDQREYYASMYREHYPGKEPPPLPEDKK
jgi:cobalt-zinc-cadmium efflux system membrane fusion protein